MKPRCKSIITCSNKSGQFQLNIAQRCSFSLFAATPSYLWGTHLKKAVWRTGMHLSNYNLFSFLLAGLGVGRANLVGALESGFSCGFLEGRGRIKGRVAEVRKRLEEFALGWLVTARARRSRAAPWAQRWEGSQQKRWRGAGFPEKHKSVIYCVFFFPVFHPKSLRFTSAAAV